MHQIKVYLYRKIDLILCPESFAQQLSLIKQTKFKQFKFPFFFYACCDHLISGSLLARKMRKKQSSRTHIFSATRFNIILLETRWRRVSHQRKFFLDERISTMLLIFSSPSTRDLRRRESAAERCEFSHLRRNMRKIAQ